VNTGVLILRLLLGFLMGGHALQKLFGFFDGHGIDGTAPLFEKWGLSPGRAMVIAAGTSELVGALLIGTGTFTALGAALVIGTMLVAATVTAPNGLWAVKQGCELPLVYGALGLGIGLIGPGRFSVDYQAGLMQFTQPGYVLGATAAAILGSAPLVARVLLVRHRRAPPSATAIHD
jgi:putative oxidoreductase